MTDYPALLDALGSAQVDFIVVGGLAAIAHGSARLTQDIDVVYRRTPENLARLAAALAPHVPYLRGAPAGLPFRLDAATLKAGLNFTLQTNLGDIDLLGEIVGGGTFEDLRTHSVSLSMFGRTVLCLDLDTLIRVKRAAGRRKDIEAVAELVELRDLKDRS